MIRRIGLPIAIVVVANAAILWSAYDNRRGDPEALVTVTGREWPSAAVSDRNSARELHWTSARYTYFQGAPWLDAAKLSSLGFDTSMPPTDEKAQRFYGRLLSRRVFAVYEFDGDAWQKTIDEKRREAAAQPDPATAKSMATQVDSERIRGSRLVPVDAGSDPAALRRAYPDRARFIIVPAVIGIHNEFVSKAGASIPRKLAGSIRAVTTMLVVPREFREALEHAEARPSENGAPRYRVTIAYGRRYEPWIVGIQTIDTPAVR